MEIILIKIYIVKKRRVQWENIPGNLMDLLDFYWNLPWGTSETP